MGENLSDDATGAPLDNEIDFKRNGNLYNQFNVFLNYLEHLRIFNSIILPAGFGISKGFNDQDGMRSTDTTAERDKAFTCDAYSAWHKFPNVLA